MSQRDDQLRPAPETRRARRTGILHAGDVKRLVVFAILLLIIVPTCAWLAGGREDWSTTSWRPVLRPSVFASAPLPTRVHTMFVVLLVAAGWMMIILPKGDRRHRTLGWFWTGAMLTMGVASLTVPHGDNWQVAYFGGASAYPLLVYGIVAVKRGALRAHGKTMVILMIALALMTLLSLAPGRLMHGVVFGG